MNRYKKLIELIKDNPDLEVIPIVYSEVVQDDEYCFYWGYFGKAYIKEYILYEKMGDDFVNVVTKDEVYEIQEDLEERDEMTDEQINEYIKNIKWKKAIFVYIDEPVLED